MKKRRSERAGVAGEGNRSTAEQGVGMAETLSRQTTADSCLSAYDPELFRELSQVWQQELTRHFASVRAGDGPVLHWNEPTDAIRHAGSFLSRDPAARAGAGSVAERFRSLVCQMLAAGQNLHHPHYLGHQVPASSPIAGLFDAVGSITNQVMAIFEMGPWATAVEHALVSRMCRLVGWEERSGTGLLTHGGSLANLTALLTARNVALPGSWEHGVPSGAALVVHSDAHYSVARAAGILGLGTRQVLRAPLDADRRIHPPALATQLKGLLSEGRTVVAVSACACSTPTGVFDPLPEIARICRDLGVWLHVDAAHGGSLLMSQLHRRKLQGLDQADSVVWDAHKMLFVPALCAAVLYRNRDHRFEAFRQDAPYLFDPSAPGMAEFDSGMRTIECTKRATGFGLWGLWSLFGESIFGDLVDRVLELASQLHRRLSEASDFETLHLPECNIVAFRHIPDEIRRASLASQNDFQRRIRARLIRSGQFYIVQTQLGDQAALRTCLMNPATTDQDLSELLQAIRETGQQCRI